MKTRIRSAALAAICVAIPVLLSRPAAAQWVVIDPSNLVENTLTAARELQQITNEITSLQNEATMLQNEALNLQNLNFSSLSGMTSDLTQIAALMNQAQGIQFTVQSVQKSFSQLYPQSYGSGTGIPQLVSDALSRWQNASNAYQQTMIVQSQIAQTVQTDTATLANSVNASQGAVGALQAQQATNQLIALSVKQQLQIQSMMAAQGRADAVKGANDTEAEEEGSAALSTFLGSGSAYTPR